ncbi:hypothetical protein QEG98_02020 [Myxococcus sp. MxC21-1]|uniref:hypothetical protein n=1 Tax=Myxococcus sp. MxC21-1 TaxID=3041439 RepID=UPI00292EE37A|nr:hypothetical protein [Myxococcus sp. MxC21-1]WNZ62631.1 hypothetical protein QEG98_02020 [Myxococcus sp. MxC21-1]
MLLDIAPSSANSAVAPVSAWASSEQTLETLSGLAPHTLLTHADLYPRICVRDPYYALKDVTVMGEGEVVARIPVQQDPDAEAGPIGLGEAGRHLAILGSCASALMSPKDGQHFYGVRRARAVAAPGAHGPRHGPAVGAGEGGVHRPPLGHRAHAAVAAGRHAVLPLGGGLQRAVRRRLHAPVRRGPGGHAPRAAPRRRRAAHPEEWAKLRQNPYSKPLALRDWRPDGESLSATLGPVTAEMCKGHFALHPVMPVAVVASGMTRVATTLLRRLEGAPWARCVAKDVRLKADTLAYAGQTVTFGAVRSAHDGDAHTFTCQASVGERVVAELDVTYTRVD